MNEEQLAGAGNPVMTGYPMGQPMTPQTPAKPRSTGNWLAENFGAVTEADRERWEKSKTPENRAKAQSVLHKMYEGILANGGVLAIEARQAANMSRHVTSQPRTVTKVITEEIRSPEPMAHDFDF